jgi:hypothetical protein
MESKEDLERWKAELNLLIRTFYAVPGQYADSCLKSRNSQAEALDEMCMTHIKGVSFGSMIDKLMKSMVIQLLINHFQFDISKQLRNQAFREAVKLGSPPQSFLQALASWFKSEKYGRDEYIKFMRDARSAIFQNWLNLLIFKADYMILSSLKKFSQWSIHMIRHVPSETKSLFGIIG